jgi:hypothetical protein
VRLPPRVPPAHDSRPAHPLPRPVSPPPVPPAHLLPSRSPTTPAPSAHPPVPHADRLSLCPPAWRVPISSVLCSAASGQRLRLRLVRAGRQATRPPPAATNRHVPVNAGACPHPHRPGSPGPPRSATAGPARNPCKSVAEDLKRFDGVERSRGW